MWFLQIIMRAEITHLKMEFSDPSMLRFYSFTEFILLKNDTKIHI